MKHGRNSHIVGGPRRRSPRRAGGGLPRLLVALLVSLGLIAGFPAASQAADDIDVYVTFEGYNLGQGYYVKPLKLTVPAGRTAAAVAETVLSNTSHQFNASHAGDTTNGDWYLSGVKGFDTGTVNVPSYITSQPGFELTGTNGNDYLDEHDYNSMSGWYYTVGNVAGDVSAGAYELHDGDVMRWQFTLYGTGCDLGVPSGCYGGTPYFTMVDKSALIRAVVDADPATATPAELTSAEQVAVDPTATQAQVDAAITALDEPEPATPWIEVRTTAQGQVLASLQALLVSDFDQTAGSYDYSVVKRLRVVGPVNSADFTAIRNTAYAATHIEELDLSGAVTTSMYALNGMTSLTDVKLPAVAALTTANLFQNDAALKNVTVAASTTSFGSTTTFTGATALERITFTRSTAPTTFNASTFNGSNNATAGARVVVAAVPDKTSGGYQLAGFKQYFADVVDIAPNPPAGAEERTGLQEIIGEATGITRISAYSDARWSAMQDARTAAQAVLDNAASTSGAVADARAALRSAIDGLLGISFKVTAGATVGLYQKGALHFTAFSGFPLTKVEELSDDDYDVYVPAETLANGTYNVSAFIHDQTDKVVRIFSVSAATTSTGYTLDLTPTSERADTPLVIAGPGFGDPRNLYTNLDDTGVLNLTVGEHFDLDTFRTAQGQNDQVSNYFIEPDYSFGVSGDSISTESIGSEGRRQLRITATEPGVSVVKIGYGPLKYVAANGTVVDFNGIEEQNTGLVVVKVGETEATFATGIGVRNELDTYYFDKSAGSRPFTFTPAEGTTVRVHDPLNVKAWGTGWRPYQPAEDGSFTVELKGGRNIVELTNDGSVEYRVVRAKGVDIAIANATNPGQPFEAGDTAQLTLKGIEGGIEKLAGIYNPAFAAGTKPKLTYSDGTTPITSNEGGQYNSVTTTYTLSYPFTGQEATLTGFLSIGGLGAEWPYHRQIPLEGKPANLNAVAIGPYQLGALPPVYVYDDQVSTRPAGAPVDKTALRAAIDRVDALGAGAYTAASWATLQDAIDVATAVVADEEATQVEVDEAVRGIDDAVVGLAMKGTAPPAPSLPAGAIAAQKAGAAWLAGQLAANDDVLGGAPTDWGLTIDAVFALAGAQVGGDQIAETADAIYHSGEAYVGAPGQLAFDWPYVAKTVLALDIAGLDPTKFPVDGGPRDLVADLRASIKPNGKWTNSSDAFKTSLGILALARTDEGVPAAAVTSFEELACSDSEHANYGAFGFGAGCGSADIDTTAMAVQALLAAGVGKTEPTGAHATDWLLQQKPDEGFPSIWGPGNTNTAGLGAQALFGVEKTTEARKAASFIQGLQLTCSTSADEDVTDAGVVTSLKAANGAIAWNAGGWETALENGIDSTNIGEWRRATAQAVLGLGAPTLGFVSAADAEPTVPSRTCPTVPETPAKPGITLEGKDVTVTWTAPADGDSPITGYTVVLSPGQGTASTKTVGAGARSAVFEGLAAATYTATVTAANGVGDSASSPVSDSVTIEPDPDPVVETSVKASAAQMVYGQTGKVTVTVTVASGTAKPSGSVSTTVGTRTITGTVSNGAATLTLPAKSLAPGNRSLTIAYAGVEGRFAPSSTVVRVTVAKATPTVKVKAPKKVERGKVITYTVTVTAPGVKPTGKVTVKIAGKSRTVKLAGNGKAKVKIKAGKRTKLGKRPVTVAYTGDAYVGSGAKKVKTRIVK